MPRDHAGRPFDQPVQRLLADLRRRVGQQGGDGVDIVGLADRVADILLNLVPARDRGAGSGDRIALDDFQQVRIGQDRREFQDRPGDFDLEVPRQTLHDLGRRIRHVLQRLGQNLPHPGDLILHEDFQNLIGHAADAVLLVGCQTGRQPRDLLRQLATDGGVLVARQDQVGLDRRRLVQRHRGADRRIGVLRQQIEKFRLDGAVFGRAATVADIDAGRKTGRVLVRDRLGLALQYPLQQPFHRPASPASAIA